MLLTTDRLRLRKMNMEDIDDLMKIFSDPEAMKYYPSTKTREEAEKWIEWTMNNYSNFGVGLWIVENKNTGEFLGQCGIVPQKVGEKVEMEIGYLFVRSVWGNGYATEAALACKEYGFAVLEYPKMVSLIDLNNQPSIKVAERIGMKRETTIYKWDKYNDIYACYL
ncbi:GNAT family N-acetyltransferase [Virgibacillus ndiopensis]|uniref:GNAT family N-acetyltransferase n=1 Tax=Virgibacillus ndiopensis TaxID=2004408 RepID=UPI000C06B362|nr:GNAT family N-acetyltransferase [Virgibacillus ndiopensis]